MKKLILLALMALPCLSFAQLGFIIHKPFSGEPLFCNDAACIRKAKISKHVKKTKRKFDSQPCQSKNKNIQQKKEKPSPDKHIENAYDTIGSIATLMLPNEEFKTKNILFAYDEYELDTTACRILDELASYFMRRNIKTIAIHGHTDSSGSISYNQILSLKRAECVKRYLIAKGIPANRLHTKYHAFLDPVSSNSSEKSKILNRRVEVKWE